MTPKVRAALLTNYVDIARSVGLDPYAMMLEKQIIPRHLQDPEWRLGAGPVISLLEESAQRANCPEFGILMARSRTFAGLGPLSLLLQHLSTPRAVVAAIQEFHYLLSDIAALDLEWSSDVALLRCHLRDENSGFQAISLHMAIAYGILSETSGNNWQPDCVHFSASRPADVKPFYDYFRSDIEFGSDFDGFSCATRSLEIPNPLADDLMAQHARSLLNLLRTNTESDTVLERARHAISLMIGAGPPKLSDVAINLGMSPRSLQRILQSEGKSFSDLLNETRRQLATRYVSSSSLPLTRVAEMVGYSGNSAFTRWFSHEFGETPRAWRSKRADRTRYWMQPVAAD